jgi:site-specific recombinase XerD
MEYGRWFSMSPRTKRPAEAPLFATRTGRRLGRDQLGKLLAKIGQRAGILNLHPHRLRHTFATEFLRNGGQQLVLQRVLGHSSGEMVRRYVQVAEADVERSQVGSSPADRWARAS